ncbi:hypothetical protein MACK_002020 [Theileria orientalis]|uniref:Uncharacterized protein n=1 Tax=Theileria orientalis TaxID=68886 RepID=A0A976MBE3_THEOR|nr:hypothetical protein MACK_002020 [Theileria orientalis]
MKYMFDTLKLNRHKLANYSYISSPFAVKYYNLNYRRLYSGTNDVSSMIEKRNLYWWQFKFVSFVLAGISSSYLGYVFVKSDYDFERFKAKLALHWNSLIYDNTLSVKYKALLNSSFGTCLSKELNDELCKYFLNIDLKKENGFRRSDAICFLSEVNIDEKNKIVDAFVSKGIGESWDHKLLSGCSLNEFAQLVEALVLEERLKSNNEFDNQVLTKLMDMNIKNEVKLDRPTPNYRMNNPLISGVARKMSDEVAKYIKDHEHEELYVELKGDLERNIQLKKKLEALSKSRRLTAAEHKRLNSINEEIAAINQEMGRLRHQHRKLFFM